MKCPSCELDLAMADRQGIEIDYCPSCRGIWLDRGELDKIIERSSRESPGIQVANDARFPIDRREREYHRKPKKKESWFRELLDFD